jgi:hypothetical protein
MIFQCQGGFSEGKKESFCLTFWGEFRKWTMSKIKKCLKKFDKNFPTFRRASAKHYMSHFIFLLGQKKGPVSAKARKAWSKLVTDRKIIFKNILDKHCEASQIFLDIFLDIICC